MYAITGASGQLGRLVVEELLKTVPAEHVVALVRDTAKAADLAGRGVEVREADYDRPNTLYQALAGARRILLISSNAVGVRAAQHQAVIEAAKSADVELLAYTSILHADATPARLAGEHKATEDAIAASGVPATILRNGWYTENHLMGLQPALEHGAMMGAAGDGRFSSAARVDYAIAAARVLTGEGHAGTIYELAGDEAYTYVEFAAELSRQAGKPVAYRDLSETEYKGVLIGAGLSEDLADVLANEDDVARADTLFDDSGTLSRLIGRATTPMPVSIANALTSIR